mmetsp:Transcript_38116/g.89328  ORF Transcript_38116/g.89328 Transcript_38116/m.89328 type:complete len:598 (+) Transcript_38116:147-1940(+)
MKAQINNAFTAEILDAVLSSHAAPEENLQTQILDIIKSDPLGVFQEDKPMARSTTTHAGDGRLPFMMNKMGTQHDKQKNMFKDFGRDREDIVHTTDARGNQRHRVNFNRHWHSDSELRRWHKGLDAVSRHDRLNEEMRERVRDDYSMMVTILAQRHNGLFRQRDPVKPKPNQGTDALRELQSALTHKRASDDQESQLRKMLEQFMNHDEKNKACLSNAWRNQGKREIALLHLVEFLHPLLVGKSVEQFFGLSEDKGNVTLPWLDFRTVVLSMGFKGDARAAWSALDSGEAGAISIAQLHKLKPYLMLFQKLGVHTKLRRRSTSMALDEAMVEDEDNEEENAAFEEFMAEQRSMAIAKKKSMKNSSSEGFLPAIKATGSRGQSSPADSRSVVYLEAPDSKVHSPGSVMHLGRPPITLLIFRNADAAHPGEAVFLRKMPPTLPELVELIGEKCAPMVSPARALFDGTLRKVKHIEDVRPGGAYLLKGSEVLLHPPELFVEHKVSGTWSIKQIDAVHTATLKRMVNPLQAIMDGTDGGSTSPEGTSPTAVCANAGLSVEPLTSPSCFWRVDKQLALKLGITNTRHRDWGIQPVLTTSAAW